MLWDQRRFIVAAALLLIVHAVEEAKHPNVRITAPRMYAFYNLPRDNIDGNKGVSMDVTFDVENFEVPADGFVRILSNQFDGSDKSHSPLFLEKKTQVESGYMELGNVQAGTHTIRLDLMAYVSDTEGSKNLQSIASDIVIFEIVFETIPRYPPPPPLKPVYFAHEYNDERWFRSLPSSKRLIKAWDFRWSKSRYYEEGRPIKIGYVGTLKLDGQKTIWIEQWRRLPRDVFKLTYYCFAHTDGEPDPLVPILKELGIELVKPTEMYSVPPDVYYSDENFPEKMLAGFTEAYAEANLHGSGIEQLKNHPEEHVRSFFNVFVANFIGTDVIVFANSRAANDLLLLEAVKMAKVHVTVMDLPNLFPGVEKYRLDALVAPSYFVKNHPSVVGKANGPCFVIHPGISNFVSTGRKRGRNGNRVSANVGFIGRLEPEKSPGLFLYAAGVLNRKLTSLGLGRARFFVVGDGPLRKVLELAAEKIGIGNDIEFLGWIDHKDMPKVLDKIDIVVQTSLRDSETFGISNIEAMGQGVPLISFGVGGSLEYSRNLSTSLIVERPDLSLLSQAMYELLTNTTLYERLSRRSVKLVNRKFRIEEMVENYARLYLGLLMEKTFLTHAELKKSKMSPVKELYFEKGYVGEFVNLNDFQHFPDDGDVVIDLDSEDDDDAINDL